MKSTATLNRTQIRRLKRQIAELLDELDQATDPELRAAIDNLLAEHRASIAWCDREIARETIAEVAA